MHLPANKLHAVAILVLGGHILVLRAFFRSQVLPGSCNYLRNLGVGAFLTSFLDKDGLDISLNVVVEEVVSRSGTAGFGSLLGAGRGSTVQASAHGVDRLAFRFRVPSFEYYDQFSILPYCMRGNDKHVDAAGIKSELRYQLD